MPAIKETAAARYNSYRRFKDAAIRYMVAVGGISVVIIIILIALYLLWVVVPMFYPAQVKHLATYSLPAADIDAGTLHYAMEEQSEIGMRVMKNGTIVFFRTKDGEVLAEYNLITDDDLSVTAFATGDPAQHLLAFGLNNGTVLLAAHQYTVTYPDDVRMITPSAYPLYDGETVRIDSNAQPIQRIAAQSDGEQTTVAAVTADRRLVIVNISRKTDFLSGEERLELTEQVVPLTTDVDHLLLDVGQRQLYFTDRDGWLYYYDVSDKANPIFLQRVRVVANDTEITTLKFLSGGISIMIGDSSGRINQWFPVRDADNNYLLQLVRGFNAHKAAVTAIAPEYYRKGLLALDAEGNLGIHYTTSGRTVKFLETGAVVDTSLAVSPRADALLLESNSKLQFWNIQNHHPEISWSSLWRKVWYESRAGPEYIWQSSSASSDFEPKFSLTPLAFGTLKASFYAMLFAIPLAIMGAIYTAYFMAPALRNIVKPVIEIMAALPTVILGFLAGLWFAPLVELYLPTMLLLFIVVPLTVILVAWLWHVSPESIRLAVPRGWEAVILIPFIVLVVPALFWVSTPLELWLFDGNMPLWFTQKLGISYDQRNSLVVGIAIGFAVIPTIFSISEDAIFGVPKHLSTGSLALGATQWQTMARVILLTASPGIFSAVMIGLGRAVGETMIVVMATGNTAIIDMNIFEGFRALSANIAMEMPESEVGSTHYRVLFLAGLVLFAATFIFNTIAEVVRQRLRVKYSLL